MALDDSVSIEKPSKLNITYERTIDGFRIWNGIFNLGAIYTRQHKGLSRNGTLIYETMPRNLWFIHWTAPSQNIDVISEVLKTMPEDKGEE